jgi:hypothetical protein
MPAPFADSRGGAAMFSLTRIGTVHYFKSLANAR